MKKDFCIAVQFNQLRDDSRDAYRGRTYIDGISILTMTKDVSHQCTLIQRTLQVQGKRIRPRAPDLIVAATASEYEMTLLTRNVSDFADIDGLLLRVP